MSDELETTVQREPGVAHQVIVHEETHVGTADSGDSNVTDIELIPPSAERIHPDAADRVKREYGIEYLSEYDVYEATEVSN